MLVVGPKEIEGGRVSVRSRSAGDQGAMGLDDFVEKLRIEEAARAASETGAGPS
jgi:threonyl-tRNA synthetase